MSQKLPYQSLTTPGFKALLDQCIHCGLCLPACPTYSVFGTEMDAPRGRIRMMRAAAEGRFEPDEVFQQHISRCLACRACEPACPSGVQYGKLVETTRIWLEQTRKPGFAERLVRRIALREMLPHRDRLRFAARMMRLYQRIGLSALVRRVNILPKRLRTMEWLLGDLPEQYPDYTKPAPAIGALRGKVAFLHGCVQDALLADVNAATIRVLQRNGYQVEFPKGQTCCGAAPLHVGEGEIARELAKRNIEAFLAGDYVAIINNAGGCGASLKEYVHLLEDDAAFADRAKRFSERVKDINEFLADHLNAVPKGEVRARVTYQDSCHLRNAQKVIQQPRYLLRAIPGIELVELKQPDRCCGSAGIYNIMQVDTAGALLDAKMADIASTGAETIVTTNAGCQLQLAAGARKAGLNARVVHLVQLLDASYAVEKDGAS